MYGVNRETPVGIETKFENVEIANIPDRDGQFLRNALIDRFYRDGRPVDARYVLKFTPIAERLVNLAITKSSDATRGQLRLSTMISLIDRTTGATVLKRDLSTINSYNIVSSEFATRVTEQNARENALNDLARQAELMLGLYFKNTSHYPQPEIKEQKRFTVFP